MATRNYAGLAVEVNEEGFLTNATQWSKDVALAIAKEEGLALTPKHLEVIDYLRARSQNGETLTLRSVGNSGIVDTKAFYELFPGAPLKRAARIAGIPKPASCV